VTGKVVLTGNAEGRIWGMNSAERVRRLIAQETAKRPIAEGQRLHVNLDYAFDPLLLRLALKMPGTAFVHGVDTVLGQWADKPTATVDLATGPSFYNEQLRKSETPFAMRLTPETRYSIERASYFGAYKGVTDLLTKYLWPEIAFHLTRLAAALKMTPNMVTGIGAILCVVATILFYRGDYWAGVACGFIFMVLDTVDGKLARCTITSSKWGNVFDHGIDLIHPPFWWYAWGVGLSAHGLALAPAIFAGVMAAILVGYVVQRLFEGIFLKTVNMDMHVWRPFDSWFRLITARRNPNMVILVASLVAGCPDIGLVAVAWWTILSLVVHGVQVMQMRAARKRGQAITSWLERRT
jgi:phosphatidylglycerophosphate synthase